MFRNEFGLRNTRTTSLFYDLGILLSIGALVGVVQLNPTSIFGGSNIILESLNLFIVFLVPGYSLLRIFKVPLVSGIFSFGLCVGISTLELMIAGATASWILPLVGIVRPLDYPWVAAFLLFQQLVLTFVSFFRGLNIFNLELFSLSQSTIRTLPFAILPLSAIVAEMTLNFFETSLPAFAVGAATLITLVTLCSFGLAKRRSFNFELAVFFLSLGVFWLSSLRGFSVTGYDIQTELGIAQETVHNGTWSVPVDGNAYGSMLSLTVLPAVIHSIAGMSPLVSFKVLYPAVAALVATLCFSTLQRFVNTGLSLAILWLVVFPNQFFTMGLPALARQEIGLLFFILCISLFFDDSLGLPRRKVLLVLFALGLAVSHYSTSYLTSALFVLGYLALQLIRMIRKSRNFRDSRNMLTWPIVLAASFTSYLWNGLITKSTSEVSRLLDFVKKNGVNFLPSAGDTSQNFLEAWLRGSTTADTINSSKITAQANLEKKLLLTWMRTDPETDKFRLKLTASREDGLNYLSNDVTKLISNISVVLGQITLILILISIVWIFLFFLSKRSEAYQDNFPFDMAAIAIVALVVAAFLRLSGTISIFYDPNRAALQLNLIFALSVAFFISKVRVQLPIFGFILPSGLLVFAVNFGIVGFLGSGNTPPWISSHSSDVYRKVASIEDIAAANWMASQIPKQNLVSSDVYGVNEITQMDGRVRFNTFPNVIPQLLDYRSFVFATEYNVRRNIAFGTYKSLRYEFEYPIHYLEKVHQVVYASDYSRVFR